jgi:multidrug efflux pump subunit AcrA (membrane-fusion protein)
VKKLQEQVIAALDVAHDDRDRAQRDLQAARQALAAAYAMPTKTDCDGCHGRKAAAITAAEAAIAAAEERIRDAERRIGICEDTTEILDSLTRRLQAALQALRQVPHDLGEVYELVYAFIRRGGKMPRPGRWITGETPVPA